jgi:hypothetical protein
VSGHFIEVTVQRQDSEWSCYWSDCTTPGQWVVMLLKWLCNARTVSGHVIEVTVQRQDSERSCLFVYICRLCLSSYDFSIIFCKCFDSVTQMHYRSLSCLGTYTSINSGGVKPVFWVQTSVRNNMVLCGHARVCTCESTKYIRNHKY